MQDTDYPDPEQLRAYAEEPMPFHQITAGHLVKQPDARLTAQIGDVEYTYRPTDIMVETAPEEWENVEDVSHYDMDHHDAAERAIDWQIEEDFICVTEFVTDAEGEPAQFDAYWVLEEVCITRPEE